MNDPQTFVIRRLFVVPVGLLVALTLTLLVVCISQGQAVAKIVILAGLLVPLTLLFLESALRRLDIDQDGITAYRLLRRRRLSFSDVTGLETVRVRNRVFLTLEAGPDDFLIVSNGYGNFPALVDALVAGTPDQAVAEETRQLAQQPPLRSADLFAAWFAVVALIYVLLAQFKV